MRAALRYSTVWKPWLKVFAFSIFAATRLMMPEHSIYVALFIGATLTATSVGITARVLDFLGSDRGEADETPELEPAAKKRAEELLASLDPATMSQLLSLAAQQAAQTRVKN